MVRNCSSVAAYRNSTSPAALLGVDAGALEDAQHPGGGGHRPAELLGLRGAAVVDRRGVDDDGEDAGFEWPAGRRPPGRRRTASADAPRLVPGAGVVSPRWARNFSASSTGAAVASSTTGARSRRTPSRTAARSVPGPACSHNDVAPPARSASASALSCSASSPAQLDPDVAPAGMHGSRVGLESGRERRRTERADLDPVQRRARQLRPDGLVGVLGGEPAGLAEHGGGGALPVLPSRVRPGQREGERAGLGLELGGLVETALDGLLRGHVPTLGARADPSHTL